MSEQAIAASAADFLAALDHAGHKLQDFSQELKFTPGQLLVKDFLLTTVWELLLVKQR